MLVTYGWGWQQDVSSCCLERWLWLPEYGPLQIEQMWAYLQRRLKVQVIGPFQLLKRPHSCFWPWPWPWVCILSHWCCGHWWSYLEELEVPSCWDRDCGGFIALSWRVVSVVAKWGFLGLSGEGQWKEGAVSPWPIQVLSGSGLHPEGQN